jgi:UDP-glucose 4-epimerase
MKVLVTGAAGMVGSHVTDVLIARGDTVYAVDDLSRGKRANIHNAAQFVEADIRDVDAMSRLSAAIGQCDAIVHQASIINEGLGAEDADIDIGVNQKGTLNLLALAGKLEVGRFIYASSVAVYGRPAVLPADEATTIPEPVASYGIGKLAAEHYVRYAAAAHDNLGFAILRYANIYGPRQPLLGEVGVIRYFIESLANGKPLIVHGDGEQVRDFLYIDDCVAATLAALDAHENLILNIGSGRPTSVNEVVTALREVVPSPIEVNKSPPRHGEIGRFWCSIDRARAALLWQPVTALRDGVRKTFDWQMAN